MQRRFRVRMVAAVAAMVAVVVTGCSGPTSAASLPTATATRPSTSSPGATWSASAVPDARFDRALAAVLTARCRAGDRLAAIELDRGSLPEVRLLARRLQAEDRRQLRQLTAWRDGWPGAHGRPGPA